MENECDTDAIRRVLLDSDDGEDFLDDVSDTDEVDYVEAREGNSESEFSCDSSSSDEEDDSLSQTEIFKATQMKNKKIVNSWIWKKKPFPRSKRAKRNLLKHLPGVKGPAKNVKSCSEIWQCLVTPSMIQVIVDCTNIYIDSIKGNFARPRNAKNTDEIEIRALIGLLYLAGIYHANRLHLDELWRMDDFKCVMSIARFRFLMRCIRFDDIGTREERKKTDRLAPIRDIFEEFNLNCQKNYTLGENVTIDEKLEAFRGRCSFKQYIPTKPNKYGVKVFALVDAQVFYTYSMEIYAGKQPEGPFCVSNKPVDVVKRLVAAIHNTGRNITTDNWFTDYDLMSFLSEKKLTLVGTLKKNKPQIPPEFKNTKNREQFTSLFGFQKEATLVSYVPKPKKNVILISSAHDDDAIDEGTGEKRKPEVISFYNMTKGGVDTVDKLCAAYNVARNTRRWPLVIFFAMLNVAGINALIIYHFNNNEEKGKRRKFLRKLAESLVQDHVERRANQVKGELREKILKRKIPAEDDDDEEAEIRRVDAEADDVQERSNVEQRADDQQQAAAEMEVEQEAATDEASRILRVQGRPREEEANSQGQETPKPKRCQPCYAEKRSRVTRFTCKKCKKYICVQHSMPICFECSDSLGN